MNYPKSDSRHWKAKLFRQTYESRDGGVKTVGHFSARIQYGGKREKFNLGTSNKETAAIKARDIYLSLVAGGWDAALKQYKVETAPKSVTTVGDLLSAIQNTSTGRAKTINQYRTRFYQIVAEALAIESGAERYDYKKGGNEAWVKKVEAVKLTELTPDLIQRWKVSYLKKAGSSPAAQRAAKISVNSTLRQARSLFAPKHLAFVDLKGIRSPFEGVKLEPRQSMRYRSELNAEQLIKDAVKELKEEPLKAFLLAVMAGLRRSEIDSLQWSAFDWEKKTLSVSLTEHFAGKSQSSLATVDLDDELVATFRGYHAKAKSPFVLESGVKPRPGAKYEHYRADRTFAQLLSWLRKKGVGGKSPIHTLRKEMGSIINERHGIYAASRALRHAGIEITAQHYLDTRKRATTGLGSLLGVPGKRGRHRTG